MFMAMLLGAAQTAAPAPAAPEKRTVVREIVIREGKAEQSTKPGERRRIMVVRKDGKAAAAAPADGSVIVINQTQDCFSETKTEPGATDKAGEQEKFTRILVCNASRGSPVGQVQRLRNTIRSIEADRTLSDETKTQVIAALNSAIASLPASE